MLTARRARVLIAVVAIALPAALWAAQWLRSPSVMAAATRRKIEATRQRWELSLRAIPDSSGTYAGLALASGGAAWSELLQSAGVPAPVHLPGGAMTATESLRLIVVSDEPAGAAFTLVRPGRAVIGVPAAGGPLRGTFGRWKAGSLPLEGVSGRALTPEPGDTPLLVSDAGEVLAVRRDVDGGVVLQLGLDLAAALYRARQGDPTADRGTGPLRASDLVPAVPRDMAERPWADELVDALMAQLDQALPCPLPRTAGLPDSRPVVVLTADQDVDDGDVLVHMSNLLHARNAGITFLLAHPEPGAPPTAAPVPANAITEILANGHGIGVHPLLRVPPDLGPITTAVSRLADLSPIAARNHLRAWAGALAVPRAQQRARIIIDLDLAPKCVEHQPCAAFVGGSTRPVRFVDARGDLLPVLQQPTAVDDASLRDPDLKVVRSTGAALSARAEVMLARAAAVQGPLVIDVHPALFAVAGEWMGGMLGGRAHVMSAEAWLDFVTRRRQSRISSPSCGAPPSAQLQPGITLHSPRL